MPNPGADDGYHIESSALSRRMTKDVVEVLEQVAAESRDRSARIYTQAEMVRAIELARGQQ